MNTQIFKKFGNTNMYRPTFWCVYLLIPIYMYIAHTRGAPIFVVLRYPEKYAVDFKHYENNNAYEVF